MNKYLYLFVLESIYGFSLGDGEVYGYGTGDGSGYGEYFLDANALFPISLCVDISGDGFGGGIGNGDGDGFGL